MALEQQPRPGIYHAPTGSLPKGSYREIDDDGRYTCLECGKWTKFLPSGQEYCPTCVDPPRKDTAMTTWSDWTMRWQEHSTGVSMPFGGFTPEEETKLAALRERVQSPTYRLSRQEVARLEFVVWLRQTGRIS